MLVLAGGFPDHERDVRPVEQLERVAKQPRQAVERGERLAPLTPSAEPLRPWGVVLQPRVRGGEHEQAARVDAGGDVAEEQLRVVEAVDQIAREHEVIPGEPWLQVAGIPLHELHLRPDGCEPETFEGHRPRPGEVALGRDLVVHLAAILQAHPRLDEAGGEVDGIDVIERPGEFESRSSHRAAEVEAATPPVRRHPARDRLHAGSREVRHAERRRGVPDGAVEVVKLEVLGHELVGLVETRPDGRGLLARLLDHGAESGMLEKVTAERIPGARERLVAGGDPRAALHEVVSAVERRDREVVVERMDLEALQGHDRRPRPLPDVADDVAECSGAVGLVPLGKHGHRTARGKVLEIHVPRRAAAAASPGRLITRHEFAQGLPVGFGGEEDVLAGRRREPRAVGLRLEAVDLDRPVERQRRLVEEVSLPVAVGVASPESRVLGPRVMQPAAALLRPPRLVPVATRLDEREELGVRDETPPDAERRQRDLLHAVLVVPAVGVVVIPLAQPHRPGRHRDPLVGGRLAASRARAPEPAFLVGELVCPPQVLERHHAHDDARGLQVDPLVLDAHEDHPGRIIPADRRLQRHREDEVVHDLAHRGPIVAHPLHARPVVVRRIEVVPRHLVHAHGHHRLERGVDPVVDEAARLELVDEEHRRVRVVEDERVAERFVPHVVGVVVADQREEPFVDLARRVERAADLVTLCGDRIGHVVGRREQHGAGRGERP